MNNNLKRDRHGAFSCRQADRRGTLYVAVMGVAIIIMAIGMSLVSVSRVNLRSTTWRQDRREARLLADAAIELGVSIVEQDVDWRSNYNEGQEYPATPMSLGNGTLAWKLVDSDGSLSDSMADPVRVYGIGRMVDSQNNLRAIYTKSVLLEPKGTGLTCLEAAFHTNGRIDFDGATWTANHFVSTNNSGSNAIRQSGSGVLNGNAEAVGTIEGAAVTGTEVENASPREMPSSSVFEYYIANGTPITYGSLPSGEIKEQVLSPLYNPFGLKLPNLQGIYVIDCQGNDIIISDSRIEGTLVLLNAGSGSKLEKSLHWEPAVTNYPALLVQGDLEMQWVGNQDLDESNLSVNFNPLVAPYQGNSDLDTSDTYDGIIKGLVYISGTLSVQDQCNIFGAIVCNDIVAQADADLTYDPTFFNYPPPGFASGSSVEISPGSWRREVSE